MVELFIRAMNYSHDVYATRQSAWLVQSRHEGFFAAAALEHPSRVAPHPKNPAQPIRGFIFGFRGMRGQWWYSQVDHLMAQVGVPLATREAILDDYTELSELHVEPGFQGHRIGETLLRTMGEHVSTQRLLLSTPEVPHEANRAFSLYRRVGFTDVVRNAQFPGDPRLFAILGAKLPLADTPPLGPWERPLI